MHPVCTMLHEAMRKLVDGKYDGNIRKAAKYLDTEYNVVYRLYHGTQRSLDFFGALRLAKATGLSQDGSLLREYYPAEFEDLGSLASDPEAYSEIIKALEFAISTPIRFEVLLFASEIKNATLTLIGDEFGKRGLLAAEELIAKKVFTILEGGIISSLYSQDHWCPESFCRDVASQSLAMLRLDCPGSFIRNHSLALNREGLVEYYKACRAAAENLAAIEKNPRFNGDKIVVSTIFMGPVSSASREGDQE